MVKRTIFLKYYYEMFNWCNSSSVDIPVIKEEGEPIAVALTGDTLELVINKNDINNPK
jgi:hypothetical protein